jgi:4-aminobutyrate aminotransferase/(S)-3-amino-2-methylpropionate transaminase
VQSLEKSGSGTAAVIVEPIQGRGGVRVPPDGWLEKLKELCVQNGVLLIFDEIFTGLGRCGEYSHADRIACDLLCLGKALGGGLPLSACVGTREVMAAWPENTGEAIHTGTFFGHPLSCRLGARVIESLKGQDLPGRAKALGKSVSEFLAEKFAEQNVAVEISGKGLMLGLKFAKPGIAVTFMNQLRGKGIIVLPSGEKADVISITPALNIDEQLFRNTLTQCCETFLQT